MGPDILLFHPPNILNPKALRTASISPILCGYGLLHIGSHLKNQGYNVECWNIPLAYKFGLNNAHIKGILHNYNPILIGIELNWLHLSKGALDLALLLKKLYPDVPIVIGGVHATLFAEQIIKTYDCIDAIVKGEAEKIMEDIVAKIEKKQDYQEVVGIISKKDGKVLNNEGKNIYQDIDKIPPYSPNLLFPKILNPYNLGMINTCRGPCNFNCIHCVGAKENYCLSPRSKITFHSVSWIIKQIQILLDYVKNISIQDYIYCNPRLMLELTKAIQKEHLQDSIEYFNLAIVPTHSMNRNVISNLSKAGIDNIDIGLESGSNYILQTLKRPYNTAQAAQVIKNSIKNGIIPKTYWMITGLERQNDIDANHKFLIETIEIGAIPKWITPLCIIPKTFIYENAPNYNISLNKTSFDDYLKFSTEKFDRNGYYPQLITHSTDLMSAHDILTVVNQLKTEVIKNQNKVFEKLKENEQYYVENQPKLFENQQIRKIKSGLEYIRGTFF